MKTKGRRRSLRVIDRRNETKAETLVRDRQNERHASAWQSQAGAIIGRKNWDKAGRDLGNALKIIRKGNKQRPNRAKKGDRLP